MQSMIAANMQRRMTYGHILKANSSWTQKKSNSRDEKIFVSVCIFLFHT